MGGEGLEDSLGFLESCAKDGEDSSGLCEILSGIGRGLSENGLKAEQANNKESSDNIP